MLKKIVLAVTLVLLCTITSSQLVYEGREEIAGGEYCSDIDIGYAKSEAELRAELGDEGYEAMRNAEANGQHGAIWFDLKTGEVSFMVVPDLGLDSTEPGIPEGLEIADLPEVSNEPGLSVTSIIGNDTRVPVANVNAYPYTASALLYVTYEDGTGEYLISGSFVSNRVILTAGHCLENKSHGQAVNVEVKPGGRDSSFSKVGASKFAVSTEWHKSKNHDYDYGIIILEESMNTGFLSLKERTDSDLKNKGVINYGYPEDKDGGTGSLWYGEGTIKSVYTRSIKHDVDTIGGNSGSPIILKSDSYNIVGIHNLGGENGADNTAVRITSSIISFVEVAKLAAGDK